MEKFYFEEPSIHRKDESISYINEFYKYNSEIKLTYKGKKSLINKKEKYYRLQLCHSTFQLNSIKI